MWGSCLNERSLERGDWSEEFEDQRSEISRLVSRQLPLRSTATSRRHRPCRSSQSLHSPRLRRAREVRGPISPVTQAAYDKRASNPEFARSTSEDRNCYTPKSTQKP